MGDALDTLTLRELADAIRSFVGPPNPALSHTVDVIVVEICRCWPERVFADYARDMDRNGSAALDAMFVVMAKVRENIEAKWGCEPSHQAALDLVLRASVVQFAHLWFSCAEARIAMRTIIEMVRHGKASLH